MKQPSSSSSATAATMISVLGSSISRQLTASSLHLAAEDGDSRGCRAVGAGETPLGQLVELAEAGRAVEF
jgi:hypothetical protein